MQLKLGEKIKNLRKRDGRKQEDLALALGVTSQVVSRWESNGSYPDMEMIPAIAHYFGISIDELFGYESDRVHKVDEYFDKIIEMNRRNNGDDVCMDECVAFARECLTEFPNESKLLYALANVLFNAGYVRYSEHHLTDADGYDVYDVARHRTYHEWQEAVKIYDRLLSVVEPGKMRNQIIRELLQLYQNMGEKEKASAIVETLPDLSTSRELMRINSCDGKDRAVACSDALLKTVSQCADLMIQTVQINETVYTPKEAAEIVSNAEKMYGLVMTDGHYGFYHAPLASICLYLSEHLWRAGDRDGAFEALNRSLEHAKKMEVCRHAENRNYTSPAVRLSQIDMETFTEAGTAALLPEDWPWWSGPSCAAVKSEIQTDPRWDEWVKRTKE